MTSIFGPTTATPRLKKKHHWSFCPPDRRNPEMKDFLRPRTVGRVKPSGRGTFVLNGEICASFADVKSRAQETGIEIIRMGAITHHVK